MCKIKGCPNDGEPICENHLSRMRRQNNNQRLREYRRDMD